MRAVLKHAALAAALAVGALCLPGCGSATGPTVLLVEDITVGNGPSALPGDTVTINYVGTLTDGTKFDSSYDRNAPLTFRLGTSQVVQGLNQGIPGMRVGGSRRLTVPSTLGYGSVIVGSIPPDSTLIFVIDLVSIKGK